MSDEAKLFAARYAIKFVRPDIVLGLGSGSTARLFVRQLAETFQTNKPFSCICTSAQTEALARSVGMTVVSANDVHDIDLTIDGADEVTPEKYMIKGGGGALLQEKVVAAMSKRHITIVDDKKLHNVLGSFPLPIEIFPSGAQFTTEWINKTIQGAGCLIEKASIRENADGSPYLTDNNNKIYDVKISRIDDPDTLGKMLKNTVGVMDHGLFVGLTNMIVVASDSGKIREIH